MITEGFSLRKWDPWTHGKHPPNIRKETPEENGTCFITQNIRFLDHVLSSLRECLASEACTPQMLKDDPRAVPARIQGTRTAFQGHGGKGCYVSFHKG